MTIPEDSLQGLVEDWWVEDDGLRLCRGRLVWANLPHIMPEQATLEIAGRDEPTNHTTALYKIASPFRMGDVKKASRLPVAGLPRYHGEVYLVQRAKVRPAIVMTSELSEVPQNLRRGETRRWTQPTAIVAPAYGASPEGRAAPNSELLRRFRRCEYANYMCLWLPDQDKPSVVRLDQMQPIGAYYQNYRLTKYRLGSDALSCLDDWMVWLFSGELPEGLLDDIRNGLLDM